MPKAEPSPTAQWGEETTDFATLKLRHRMVECWPSFDAIRQYEWIRKGGQFNMLTEMSKVIDEMQKLGFYDALVWLQTCREEKIFFGNVYSEAMEYYNSEVPHNKWFDADFVRRTKRSEISDKEREIERLKRELARMKKGSK